MSVSLLGIETARGLLMRLSVKLLLNMRKISPNRLSLMRDIIRLKNTVRHCTILVSLRKKYSEYFLTLFAGTDIRSLLLGM